MTRLNEFGQPVGDAVSWSGATRPVATVMQGTHVRLEPLTVAHAPEVLDALGSPADLWTYQSEEQPADVADVAAAIAAVRDTPDRLPFAVIDQADGALVGRVSYLRVQPSPGSIEVGGIIFSPRLQRTRGATEAQYLLMRHAFDDLGYRRYEWKCDALNAPSVRAALRLGFTQEGTWRNAVVMKGRNRDTTWFSITDKEWPAVRAALEAWLDDANFTADGVQRRSLAELRAA